MMSTVVLATVMSAVITRWLCKNGSRFGPIDVPNERSLHRRPTPRGGGLAIVISIAICSAWLLAGHPAAQTWATIACGAGVIAAVSFYDDHFTVAAGWRLLVHVIVSTVTVAQLYRPSLADGDLWWSAALVLLLTWVINLYNFMDGMDGLAAGMTVIGFGSCAVLVWLAGDSTLSAVYGVCGGAALGFLIFNLPPARIFMGDVGSSSLGYLAAALGLFAVKNALVHPVAVCLVFSPFLVDASVTLIRRTLHGEVIWRPHRTHFYQRLVRAGWGYRRTMWAQYVAMCAAALCAIISTATEAAWPPIVAAWVIIYSALILAVHKVERSARCPRGNQT